MKNKEWAVILSGQPRSNIEAAYDGFKDFVSDIGEFPDPFCHMMISNKVLSVWGDGGWNRAARQSDVVLKSTDDIINTWKPFKYKIENYDDLDFKLISDHKLAAGLSMTYGIKKSFELLKEYEKENDFKYKYVIKYRYDLDIKCKKTHEERIIQNSKMNLNTPLFGKIKYPQNKISCDFWNQNGLPDNNLIEEIDNNIDWNWIKDKIGDDKTIIVSPGWNWGGYGCCDLFLIGSRNSMESYSLYHNRFKELKNLYSMNEGVLRHYLEKIMNFDVINYYFGDVGIYR